MRERVVPQSGSPGVRGSSPIGKAVPGAMLLFLDNVIQDKDTVGQVGFAVDAALVEWGSDSKASNDVPKIGKVSGVRDVVSRTGVRVRLGRRT
ncbi:hypothetical protein [Streptomyces sp. NPDC020362]|uniref:hypothetical protein n=1 Tax=unclassified Streptomyces TaxID=2593676 RepID=UPI000AB3C359